MIFIDSQLLRRSGAYHGHFASAKSRWVILDRAASVYAEFIAEYWAMRRRMLSLGYVRFLGAI